MIRPVEILEEARRKLLIELEEIERSIAQLKGLPASASPANRRPHPRDYRQRYQVLKDERNRALSTEAPTVRPGQFKGMEMSAALQAYLLERKEPAPLPKALMDLAVAGTKTVSKYANDLNGQARKYLTITIRNNKEIFGFDKKKDVVWLLGENRAA